MRDYDDFIVNGSWHTCECGSRWSDSDGGPCCSRCESCGELKKCDEDFGSIPFKITTSRLYPDGLTILQQDDVCSACREIEAKEAAEDTEDDSEAFRTPVAEMAPKTASMEAI